MNPPRWLRQLIQSIPDENKPVHTAYTFDYFRKMALVETTIRTGEVGQVKLHGVYWLARSHSSRIIEVGENVKVLYREGLTLIIEPLVLQKFSEKVSM